MYSKGSQALLQLAPLFPNHRCDSEIKGPINFRRAIRPLHLPKLSPLCSQPFSETSFSALCETGYRLLLGTSCSTFSPGVPLGAVQEHKELCARPDGLLRSLESSQPHAPSIEPEARDPLVERSPLGSSGQIRLQQAEGVSLHRGAMVCQGEKSMLLNYCQQFIIPITLFVLWASFPGF